MCENHLIKELLETKNDKNKIYKFILVLSLLDYFEDIGSNNSFNQKVPIENLVDYYSVYLKFSEISSISFASQSNENMLNLLDQGKYQQFNKEIANHIKENPLRYLTNGVFKSSFFISDDTKIINSKNEKRIRTKETFGSFFKIDITSLNDIDTKSLSYSIRKACEKRIFEITNIKLNSTFKLIISDEESLSMEEKTIYKNTHRVGQNIFRAKLLEKHKCKCQLCNIDNASLLKASHIKPWIKCDSYHEQTSVNNGLLLCAIHDNMFDRYLISFNNENKLLISNSISEKSKKDITFNVDCLDLNSKTKTYYMNHHYNMFLKKESQ